MQSIRINTIVNAVAQCDTVCDVGCDHGYIGNALLQRNVAKNVIFVDVSQPSLDKARKLVGQNGNARFVCQDGLQSLSCDCAVIAGMGGLEIISILDNAQHKPQFVVLQPMRNQIDVRKYLTDNGYNIFSDFTFADEKFYDLISARLCDTKQSLSQLQLQFGLTNLACPTADFVAYLTKQHKVYQNIVKQCNDCTAQNYLDSVVQALAYIKEN